jgi:hypothetical protein
MQGELLGNTGAAVGRMIQAVLQDRVLHLLGYPVRMGSFGSGKSVKKSLGSVGLIVPPDLVELLPAVPADLAGFGNVAEFFSKF